MDEGLADAASFVPLGERPLGERLAAIRARHPGVEPEVVADVVRAVLATMHGDLTSQETSLLAEVEALGRTIAAAKAELSALRVDDITGDHIPTATDELDAIVAHTATATDQILEVCETLDQVGGQLRGKAKQQLQDATTRIYEACSFQDITGQRITKVVATLKAIESKVAHLMHAFGDRGEPPLPAEAPSAMAPAGVPAGMPAGMPVVVLENGPQLPANAMAQSDIDRLLASFD